MSTTGRCTRERGREPLTTILITSKTEEISEWENEIAKEIAHFGFSLKGKYSDPHEFLLLPLPLSWMTMIRIAGSQDGTRGK